MANDKFGGTMILTLGDGRRVKMRGDFEVDPTSYTKETEKNLDGSFASIVKLRNHKASMSLELPAAITAEALLGYDGNLTIEEAHTGRTHLFTDGTFTGDPKTDRMTGKTTGLAFESTTYRVI